MIEAAVSLYNFVKIFPHRFSRAYADCWTFVPEVPYKEHPNPRLYDRKIKELDWPSVLDEAEGCFDRSDLDEYSATHSYTDEIISPLHAITQKISRIFKWVKWGANVEAKDVRGQTPAYWAAYQGHLKKLMLLHSQKASLTTADKGGKTPLRAAAKYGHKWIITYFANVGCDLNVADGRGLTPLQVAAKNCQRSAYDRLLQLGANPDLTDPLGRTAKEIYALSYRKYYADTFFPIRLFIKTPEEIAASLK